MGKIVGNILFLVLATLSTITQADIALKLFDMNHVPLAQAGAGNPFIVEVSVSDVSSIGQSPTIEGIERFDVKNTGVRISSINGKTTGKYSFELRIDQPGTYTIGPAHLTDRGKRLESNRIRVVVGQEQVEHAGAAKSKKQEAPVLLRLLCDKKRVVVGERIGCKLRFYFSSPGISLRQFIEPESKDLRRKKADGPFSGTETLDGVDYNYVEWEWDVYPLNAGTITIPAYGANYEREMDRDDLWGGLGRLFGSHIETKRVYSNAISLQVDPIPQAHGTVNAIGDYQTLFLSAQPAVAKQGEGIVVAVDVVGDGDPDGVQFPALHGVPAELKFYESKQSFTPAAQGQQSKKRFEFIVQGLKTGNWEIPPQSLRFYNTRTKKFDEIHSTPLSITIMPGAYPTPSPALADNNDASERQADSPSIAALHTVGRVPVSHTPHLPWWLFAILLFAPFFILLYQLVLQTVQKTRQASYRSRRAQKAFTQASRQIKAAQKDNAAQQLYTIFIQAFADRWQEPIAAITQEYITQRLAAAGMPEAEQEQWQEYLTAITQRAFGAQQTKQDEQLFTQAEQWIERFQKRL